MANKPMSDVQKYRRANARGLDRDAMERAKKGAAGKALESSLSMSGNDRKTRFGQFMKLQNEGQQMVEEKQIIAANKDPFRSHRGYKNGGEVTRKSPNGCKMF